jgi:hypothetical protein
MKERVFRSASLAVVALTLFALQGCLMFERAPAALTCDPELVDRWIPIPSEQDAIALKAEDYADVDAQCHVHLSTSSGGGKAEFDALGFQSGGQRYLALDRTDLDGLFAVPSRPPSEQDKLPDTAVFLLKYRIQGEQLEIALPDMPYIVQQVTDKQLPAQEVDTSVYLVRGHPEKLLKVLDSQAALFEAFDSTGEPLRLRRATAMERP